MDANDSPDGPLVAQALSGNRAAFGTLIERHRPMAARLAQRMLADPAEADDAAQEACLHAFLSLDRLRDPERFGSWLCGIVVNLCRMRLRARRAVYSLEDWDGGRVARGFTWSETQLSAEAVFEIRELHRIILRAIELLPVKQQAVVRWHYLDGLTLSEIGVLAGAPPGTVKARLHRARKRLREELLQQLNDYTPLLRRKEKPAMIEVVVHDVIIRTPPTQDVIEAMSRELPGPDVKEVRHPLPEIVFLKNAPDSPPPSGQLFEKPIEPGDLPPSFQLHRVVLLQEKNGERLLPIWVGSFEGDMIKLLLAEKDTPRPRAYELMKRLLDVAQATIERVVISRLHEQVFYATLFVHVGDQTHEVDARPSDALALALRVKAPIFVAPEIMETQGVKPEALQDKLGEGQSRPTAQIMWISAPVLDFKLPTPPEETK